MKGTSAEQDSRFSDKQKKTMKSMKFPANFDQKVDTKKINQDVIRAWVSQKIYTLLKFDDDILVGFVMENMQERVSWLKAVSIQEDLQFVNVKGRPMVKRVKCDGNQEIYCQGISEESMLNESFVKRISKESIEK